MHIQAFATRNWKRKQLAITAEECKFGDMVSNLKLDLDDLSALTVLEAEELSRLLVEKWGVTVDAPIGVAGSSPPGVSQEVPEFDVILASFGDNKINVIKEVRAITGLGLGEAKALVEGAPKAVRKGVAKAVALDAVARLELAGATAQVPSLDPGEVRLEMEMRRLRSAVKEMDRVAAKMEKVVGGSHH